MSSVKELHKIYGDSINHPAALVMSGVESDSYWDIAISAGFDRLLVSYHYIQRKGKKWLKERMEKHPDVKLMIDSGAFTFHQKEDEYKLKPMEYWESYLEKYTNFIKANKDIIFSCVELDIANIVGFEKVDEFREKYFEPLRDEGVLVCYVWHGYDGLPYWEKMCKKYDYVGFSLQEGSVDEKGAMRMVNIARRYGAVVHGFAATRIEMMSRVPFFTTDSTTWLVGTQYGELNWFDGRKMKRLKKADWKTVYKQKYIKLGANWDLAGQENPYELIRINALVFREAEKYVRKRIQGKSYWLDKSSKEGAKNDMAKLILKRPKKEPVAAIEEVDEKPVVKKKPKLKIKPKKKRLKLASKKKKEPEESKYPTPPIETQNKPVSDDSRTLPVPADVPKSKFEVFQELTAQKNAPKEERSLEMCIEMLPEADWFETECEDYDKFARLVGLPASLPKDDILDILFNYTLFLRDTELLEDYEDDQLIEIGKLILSKTFSTREEVIQGLTEFYIDNITGRRNDFADDISENLDAPPRPKEREEYLEDEEYEWVDMSETELENMLPEPEDMPEVDELDKELAQKGIVAVRDEKGRFLKGQKKVRKPKNLASKHFPKLACDTCYKAGECPEFKPGYACAYEKIFKKFDTRNFDDVMDGMFSMTNLNMERMQRLMMFETMDGGMADPALTAMIDQNMRLMDMAKKMHETKSSIVATQRRTMRADGTEETTTSVHNPSGGILAQIFGMPTKDSENRERKEVSEDDILEMED